MMSLYCMLCFTYDDAHITAKSSWLVQNSSMTRRRFSLCFDSSLFSQIRAWSRSSNTIRCIRRLLRIPTPPLFRQHQPWTCQSAPSQIENWRVGGSQLVPRQDEGETEAGHGEGEDLGSKDWLVGHVGREGTGGSAPFNAIRPSSTVPADAASASKPCHPVLSPDLPLLYAHPWTPLAAMCIPPMPPRPPSFPCPIPRLDKTAAMGPKSKLTGRRRSRRAACEPVVGQAVPSAERERRGDLDERRRT